MNAMKRPQTLDTLLVHGASRHIEGALTTPIFQTSTFASATSGPPHDAVRYTRLSNGPQHVIVHERLALLTGHERAITSASGMAAIAATLMTHARGGRIFFQRGVYGGTSELARRHLSALGITCDIAPDDDVSAWRRHLRPDTKVLYVEAISNPLATVIDLCEVVAIAREIGALAIIDATFASPVNLRPADLGFDLEIHSATKYMNGHSDVIAGVVCGRASLVGPILDTQNHLGGVLDPHAAFLLERGLKTMALRVARQSDNALTLARLLSTHPAVSQTFYPGLDPSLVPERLRPHFRAYGGVLSFDLDSRERAEKVLSALTVATVAPSLGGTETLVTRPAETSHAAMTTAERRALGITDGTVRVACGIEGTQDLVDDFREALSLLA